MKDTQLIQEVKEVLAAASRFTYGRLHLSNNAPTLLQRLVDALEEANRENAEMKKLLMDVSEHLSWRNVDGSGPAKALGMIYTWAALSHKEDKTDDRVD